MHQVAEFSAAERVVAEVLDDGAAVSVRVCLLDLFFGKSRISLEQKGTDFVSPQQIHDFLVRENGVRERTTAAHEHDQKKCRRTDRTQAPTDFS
jgi:hypothetical protein